MHLAQPIRLFVDDRQRLFAEMLDDAARGDRPDATNESGPEVFANPLDRRRKHRAEAGDTKLAPMLRVARPKALKLDTLARVHAAQLPDRRDLCSTRRLELEDGIAAGGMLVGQALDDALHRGTGWIDKVIWC